MMETIKTINTNSFSHVHWIKEIGEYIAQDNPHNIIKFSLAYTLQSLRAGEDINRFKWKNNDKNNQQKRFCRKITNGVYIEYIGVSPCDGCCKKTPCSRCGEEVLEE